MALVHGKDTYVSIDAVDLSAYVKTSEFTREIDEHDVTTYGNDSHIVRGGLLGGKFSMSGVYDTTAVSGPRAKLNGLIAAGINVTLIRRPEGTGSGKPQDSVSVLVKSYVETNPVDDYVAWSCECTLAGDVDSTAQSA
jgi:hypothetical protein